MDGRDGGGGESGVFGCFAWLGVSAHNAEAREILLASLHRYIDLETCANGLPWQQCQTY